MINLPSNGHLVRSHQLRVDDIAQLPGTELLNGVRFPDAAEPALWPNTHSIPREYRPEPLRKARYRYTALRLYAHARATLLESHGLHTVPR